MSGIEVLKDKCIGCSLCSKICPQGAIEMKDNKAEIGDACNLCGTCVAKCPVKAIVKAGATLDNLSEWDVSHLKDCRDVWVVTELRDGQIAGCTYELLGEARRLTVGTEHKVAAVLLCEEAGDYPGQLIAGGADIVYLMQDQVFHRFLDQPYKEAIVSLVKEEKPLALLLSATAMGRSLAPRLAANLRTGLTADCTKLELRDNGLLIQTRPTFGGNLYASLLCPCTWPQMATVRAKVMQPLPPDLKREGKSWKRSIRPARLPCWPKSWIIWSRKMRPPWMMRISWSQPAPVWRRSRALQWSRSWPRYWAALWACPVRSWTPGWSPMNTRSARPVRRWGLSCISPVVSPAQCSMWSV